ncbi:MAG TPA: hypothetical protein PLO25_00125 [Candidatus Saccharibacteria bacterium]|nr:hypothetical protein [Candidatus Saccharibacteria bacterium]
MAKVLKTETGSQIVSSSYPFLATLLIGLLVGFLFWCFMILIEKYVIDPLYCRNEINALMCMNSTSVSGNISAILTGLIGVFIMVRYSMARPLMVALASLLTLWGLIDSLSVLVWTEAIVWSISLYCLSYLLFSWIARFKNILFSALLMVIIVLAVRIIFGM